MCFRGTKWEAEFLKNVESNAPADVEVLRFSSLTLEVELENNTNSVLPFFTLNVGIMIAFCVVTCMMTDWVKSKPLLGFMGVVSAILGTIAALGLAVYIGIPFTGINLAAPFLMLGKSVFLAGLCHTIYIILKSKSWDLNGVIKGNYLATLRAMSKLVPLFYRYFCL